MLFLAVVAGVAALDWAAIGQVDCFSRSVRYPSTTVDAVVSPRSVSSGLASLSAGVSELFDRGRVLQSVVEMHGGYLLLMSVGDGSQLAVAASADWDIRRVGYEMAVLVERVGSEVEALPTTVVRSSLDKFVLGSSRTQSITRATDAACSKVEARQAWSFGG